MPKHVGTWVLAATPECEIMKWGLNGDTEFPFPPDDVESLKQAEYLSQNNTTDTFYIIHVFDNGQMKQFQYP